MDLEMPLDAYFHSVAEMWPSTITPEYFAEFQRTAGELHEALRRELQGLYDLLEHLGDETTPEELLALMKSREAREQARTDSIRAISRASLQRAIDDKKARAQARAVPTTKANWWRRLLGIT